MRMYAKVLHKVTDGSNSFYYDNYKQANDFLNTCANGDICSVWVKSTEPLRFYNGRTISEMKEELHPYVEEEELGSVDVLGEILGETYDDYESTWEIMSVNSEDWTVHIRDVVEDSSNYGLEYDVPVEEVLCFMHVGLTSSYIGY